MGDKVKCAGCGKKVDWLDSDTWMGLVEEGGTAVIQTLHFCQDLECQNKIPKGEKHKVLTQKEVEKQLKKFI